MLRRYPHSNLGRGVAGRGQPSSTRVATFVVAALTIASASMSCVASFGAPSTGARLARLEQSPHRHGGRFENPRDHLSADTGPTAALADAFGDQLRRPICPLPMVPREEIVAAWKTLSTSGLRVTWLGHSTLRLDIDGLVVVTDPVFGDRASPFDFIGPQRFHPPPVEVDDLADVDVVVISHDHYDHLDMGSVQALARTTEARFLVPLGVGAHLESWGIAPERITEHDWYESTVVDGVRFVSTPSQHFSGRSLMDQNHTLWTTWSILGPTHRVFFSGDTGLTPQFVDVGERFGPFDVAFFEIGAWHPAWGQVHLGPRNALKAFSMINARTLWPIHWGTFELALHDWSEPIETLDTIASTTGVDIARPMLGFVEERGRRQTTAPQKISQQRWWREQPPLGAACSSTTETLAGR